MTLAAQTAALQQEVLAVNATVANAQECQIAAAAKIALAANDSNHINDSVSLTNKAGRSPAFLLHQALKLTKMIPKLLWFHLVQILALGCWSKKMWIRIRLMVDHQAVTGR